MDFYKHVKLEKINEDTYLLTIKVNDMFSQTYTLKSDQLEHIINAYRKIK